jgi:hypothetical protein
MRYYHKTPNHPFSFIVVCLALVALGFFAYDYTSGRRVDAEDNALVGDAVDTSTKAAPLNTEKTALLNRIEAIKLDGAILSDKAFLSLQDWTVALGTEEVGKSNPFAPVPSTVKK